jgi:hypothetical protein
LELVLGVEVAGSWEFLGGFQGGQITDTPVADRVHEGVFALRP